MSRRGKALLAVLTLGAALWLGVLAGALTAYHHFTR